MKTKIVIIAENDKPIPEGYSKKEVEEILKATWELFAETISLEGDRCYIESAEIEE